MARRSGGETIFQIGRTVSGRLALPPRACGHAPASTFPADEQPVVSGGVAHLELSVLVCRDAGPHVEDGQRCSSDRSPGPREAWESSRAVHGTAVFPDSDLDADTSAEPARTRWRDLVNGRENVARNPTLSPRPGCAFGGRKCSAAPRHPHCLQREEGRHRPRRRSSPARPVPAAVPADRKRKDLDAGERIRVDVGYTSRDDPSARERDVGLGEPFTVREPD